MKKYIESDASRSSDAALSSVSLSDLTETQMIDLWRRYTRPDGMYGHFENASEAAKFFCMLDRLEYLGYEV